MAKSNKIVKEMERVFDIEIEALQSVRKSLSSEFENAVRTIAACRPSFP